MAKLKQIIKKLQAGQAVDLDIVDDNQQQDEGPPPPEDDGKVYDGY